MAESAKLPNAINVHPVLPDDPEQIARLTPEQLNAKRKADRGALAFANEMPLYKIPAMSGGSCSDARVDELIRAINEPRPPSSADANRHRGR